MTTVLLAHNQLAADTRVNIIHNGYRYIYDGWKKIKVNPLFASVGAGPTATIIWVQTFPVLVSLMTVGFAIVPFFGGRRSSPKENADILIAWRNGVVSVLEVKSFYFLGLIFMFTRNIETFKTRYETVIKNGSGAVYFDCEELEDITITDALERAYQKDLFTGPVVTVFDLKKWEFTQDMPPEVSCADRKAYMSVALFGIPPEKTFKNTSGSLTK